MGNGEGAAALVTFIAAEARVSWRAGSYGRLRSSGCGSRTRGVHPWHGVGARLGKVREEERVAVWCGRDAGVVRARCGARPVLSQCDRKASRGSGRRARRGIRGRAVGRGVRAASPGWLTKEAGGEGEAGYHAKRTTEGRRWADGEAASLSFLFFPGWRAGPTGEGTGPCSSYARQRRRVLRTRVSGGFCWLGPIERRRLFSLLRCPAALVEETNGVGIPGSSFC